MLRVARSSTAPFRSFPLLFVARPAPPYWAGATPHPQDGLGQLPELDHLSTSRRFAGGPEHPGLRDAVRTALHRGSAGSHGFHEVEEHDRAGIRATVHFATTEPCL